MTVDGPVREPARPRPAGKLRKLGKFIVIVLMVGFAWTAWAGYALYDLATAVQALDPIALERRVDWVAVQQGLREDLPTESASGNGFTRQLLARAVQRAKLDGLESEDGQFWSRIEYAGYSGGPFAFRVDLKPDGGTPGATMTLLFKWSGDWRLARVFVPVPVLVQAATASAPPLPLAERANVFPPPPLASVEPALSVASSGPRAILFEEDSTDPQGKRYDGSVSWRTELTPPAADGTREPVVRADIAMPERPLSMTMWIRRNTDKTLPASHTFEVKFDLPADSNTGGIQEVPGVMLKHGEDGRAARLAAISVGMAPNAFLIGLSAIELDIEHNTRMLRDRSWFDIPIAYKSKNRAVLAIEKGATGEKIVADAVAQWAKTSASEKHERTKP